MINENRKIQLDDMQIYSSLYVPDEIYEKEYNIIELPIQSEILWK